MTTNGTNYFQSLSAAVEYYKFQGLNRSDVRNKIATGEIGIGYPKHIVDMYGSKLAFKLGVDADGRYNYSFKS